MKLDEIQKEIDNDSKIDKDDLSSESLRIPYIYGKWINIFSMERAFLIKYKRDLSEMSLFKVDYYKGVKNPEYKDGKISPIKYDTKAERETAFNGDREVLDLIQKVDLQKVKIESIELFLKAIHSKGFQIKSAIDYIKFKNGV